MNGLLAQPATPDPAAAPPGSPPPAAPAPGQGAPPMDDGDGPDSEGAGDDDSNVTPEEQAAYEDFVNKAYELIYSPPMRPVILKRLAATGQPIEDLANTAVLVVQRVVAAAKQAGTTIGDDVLMQGGTEIVEDLGEYAGKAGLHKFTEKELTGAYYRALDLYRDAGEKDGSIDGNQLKQQFGELQQADAAGKLNEVLPGIDKAPGEDAAGQEQPEQGAPPPAQR